MALDSKNSYLKKIDNKSHLSIEVLALIVCGAIILTD